MSRKVLRKQRQVLGDDHLYTLNTTLNLCSMWLDRCKNLEEALKLCQQAKDGFVRKFGHESKRTIKAKHLYQEIEHCKKNGRNMKKRTASNRMVEYGLNGMKEEALQLKLNEKNLLPRGNGEHSSVRKLREERDFSTSYACYIT